MSAEVDGAELFAVIPFIDMLNHANSAAGVNGDLAQVPESAVVGGQQASITLVANRGYAAGDELKVVVICAQIEELCIEMMNCKFKLRIPMPHFQAYDNVTNCHSNFLAMYVLVYTAYCNINGTLCLELSIENAERMEISP